MADGDASSLALAELVAGIVAAVDEAGAVIRSVHGSAALNARIKDADGDDRTVVTAADGAAQRCILGRLRARWPDLRIVAEEDEGGDDGADDLDLDLDSEAAQEAGAPSTKSTLGLAEAEKVAAEVAAAVREHVGSALDFATVASEEICLFVDPLDGTREFVHGRLHACQTLVGVAFRGRPVVGVVGLPFHHGTIGAVPSPDPGAASGISLCGVVGRGLLLLTKQGAETVARTVSVPVPALAGSSFCRAIASASNAEAVAVAKADVDVEVEVEVEDEGEGEGEPARVVLATSAKVAAGEEALAAVAELIGASSVLPAGGCGNKALHLLCGAADVALFNLRTSLWDTCALQAVLESVGGLLTTLPGFPIEHTLQSPEGNPYGVLASGPRRREAHAPLCEALRALPGVAALFATAGLAARGSGPQALDIARDIHGEPLTSDQLSRAVFGRPGAVASYACAESSAVRYKQSLCCRVDLFLVDDGGEIAKAGAGAGAEAADSRGAVRSAFLKRSVMRELPQAMLKAVQFPFKILRDVGSMQVEANVLASPSLAAFRAATAGSCKVPTAYLAQQRAFAEGQTPIDSRFVLLLEDLGASHGWRQPADLDAAQTRAALRVLAQWHAFFWQGERGEGEGEGSAQPPRGVPGCAPAGSYWTPKHQPADLLTRVVPAWKRFLDVFADELAALENVDAGEGAGGVGGVGAAVSRLGSLAARLVALAPTMSGRAHLLGAGDSEEPGAASAKHSTIIHGDPKAANFFFRPADAADSADAADAAIAKDSAGVDSTSGSGSELEVGLIDFQWTGFGLPGTDLAYFLGGAACKGVPLEGTRAFVEGLLEHYHEAFVEAAVRFGVAASAAEAGACLPLAVLRAQVDAGLLDLAPVVLADHWGKVTPEVLRAREGKLSFNANNKSVRGALCFVQLVADALDAVEVEV